MCLSPIVIKDNSVYHSDFLTSPRREVPCGRCSECSTSYMREWQTRICFELDALYKRGDVACFLTFTYDDEQCRLLWSNKKYGHNGFMFPKFSKKKAVMLILRTTPMALLLSLLLSRQSMSVNMLLKTCPIMVSPNLCFIFQLRRIKNV